MSKVTADTSISVDGFATGVNQRLDAPFGDGVGQDGERLHRWMFERASSVVCRRSTSLRRDCTWLDRVPAENRAMKSFSCAIFC